MSTGQSRITVRPDLIHQQVWMGRQLTWVIKDPISGDFFYFGDREHQILSCADGRTVSETLHDCRQQPGLSSLTEADLNRFLNDAIQKRIISVAGLSPTAAKRSKRHGWHHPLAMRLPGIQPTKILDRLLPLTGPLTSTPALAASCLLIAVALMTVITHFDAFADDVAQSAHQLRTPSYWLLLMAVIAAAKIVHELSHAVACRRLGGQVRELGVMLLVGIPCLYCDVSDAWLFDRRWKRIVVSAAGIWAELTLAAIATLVWAWTIDGPLQDICVTLVIVCSASTIFINANPLLRYDGYYILSDLIGIPNLASQSKSLLRNVAQSWLWGIRIPMAAPPIALSWSPRKLQIVLATYGILSGTYRLFVLTVILWWCYLAADYVGLGVPVGIAILALAAASLLRRSMTLLSRPRSATVHGRGWRRVGYRASLMTAMVLLVTVIPLPRHMTAPMTIQPIDAHELFVTTPGRVIQQVDDGSIVRQGDALLTLQNPNIDSQLVEFESRCTTLRTKLENLRNQRGFGDQRSQTIPAVEKSLSDAKRQLDVLREQSRRLVVKAPQDGVVFAPAARQSEGGDDRFGKFWSGTPLDPINRGTWLEQGTVIGTIGDPFRREALLLVPQEQIELLSVGQPVTAMLGSVPRGSISGTVTEVAVSPAIPAPGASQTPNHSPRYQVRVLFDDDSMTLPVHLNGRARITVDRASMLQRITRFLAGAFETTQLASTSR